MNAQSHLVQKKQSQSRNSGLVPDSVHAVSATHCCLRYLRQRSRGPHDLSGILEFDASEKEASEKQGAMLQSLVSQSQTSSPAFPRLPSDTAADPGSHTCPARPFPRHRFGPEVNTFPSSPPAGIQLFNQHSRVPSTLGLRMVQPRRPGGEVGGGAEQEAWQRGKTHASLQESWLKRQVKMNLPSTSSSSEGEVSCLRLDRMLM